MDPNSDVNVVLNVVTRNSNNNVNVVLRVTTVLGTLVTMLGCISRLLQMILGTLITMLTLY